jgi:hypothetical protein
MRRGTTQFATKKALKGTSVASVLVGAQPLVMTLSHSVREYACCCGSPVDLIEFAHSTRRRSAMTRRSGRWSPSPQSSSRSVRSCTSLRLASLCSRQSGRRERTPSTSHLRQDRVQRRRRRGPLSRSPRTARRVASTCSPRRSRQMLTRYVHARLSSQHHALGVCSSLTNSTR